MSMAITHCRMWCREGKGDPMKDRSKAILSITHLSEFMCSAASILQNFQGIVVQE